MREAIRQFAAILLIIFGGLITLSFQLGPWPTLLLVALYIGFVAATGWLISMACGRLFNQHELQNWKFDIGVLIILTTLIALPFGLANMQLTIADWWRPQQSTVRQESFTRSILIIAFYFFLWVPILSLANFVWSWCRWIRSGIPGEANGMDRSEVVVRQNNIDNESEISSATSGFAAIRVIASFVVVVVHGWWITSSLKLLQVPAYVSVGGYLLSIFLTAVLLATICARFVKAQDSIRSKWSFATILLIVALVSLPIGYVNWNQGVIDSYTAQNVAVRQSKAYILLNDSKSSLLLFQYFLWLPIIALTDAAFRMLARNRESKSSQKF